MAFSTKDSILRAQAQNFSTVLSASPLVYHQTATTAIDVTTAVTAFVASYDELVLARANGVRSKTLTASKNDKREAMLDLVRPIYAYVQNSAAIGDSDKIALGVVVKKTNPTPVGAPTEAPGLDTGTVAGRAWSIGIHPKPSPAYLGVKMYTFVGPEYPADPLAWQYMGDFNRDVAEVTFPDEVPAGAQVWATATFYTRAALTGPLATPVTTFLQYAGTSTPPAELKIAA